MNSSRRTGNGRSAEVRSLPERHSRGGDEHPGLLAKQAAAAPFFVTQVVYDVNATKDLVSD